jgi:sarcosine oxidase, subunit gamma
MSDEAARPAPELPKTPYVTLRGECRIASWAAGRVLQVLARPFAAEIASRLGESTDDGAYALRAVGPGSWYIVSEMPLTPRDVAQLETTLGPQTWLIDQTHGRVRVEISGPGAMRRLTTGTAVDLSSQRFPVGAGCETLFGHIGIHLTRTGDDRFELLVGRSYAVSLWEQLTK